MKKYELLFHDSSNYVYIEADVVVQEAHMLRFINTETKNTVWYPYVNIYRMKEVLV